MLDHGTFTALTLFGLAALALFAAWSRRNTGARLLAVLVFVGMIAPVAGISLTALSLPAPYIPGITAPGGTYFVLATKMVQDEAIYVWIDGGQGVPRYYALPWSNELAEKLQDMIEGQQRGENGGVTMDIPYEFSWDNHAPSFQPLPQPPMMPPKQVPEQPFRFTPEQGA